MINTEESKALAGFVSGLSTILNVKDADTIQCSKRYNVKQMSYLLGNFLRSVCTPERPLIMVLDDLQWSDSTSLDLLTLLLSEASLPHWIFIGTFRTNEVNSEHILSKHISQISSEQTHSLSSISRLPISNLSPSDIEAFVAETLGMSKDEVESLSELLYSKTLGNIFYCRYAMEELVRKNVIYYDVMVFGWTYNILNQAKDSAELESLLSDDVLDMIQAKLRTLPDILQRALVLASHVRNLINVPMLHAILHADGHKNLNENDLLKFLHQAASEGLLLKCSTPTSNKSGRSFKFSHDKVQEAANMSIQDYHERHTVSLTIASVLMGIANKSKRVEDEWMLFVALDHLNRVPYKYVSDQILKLLQRR